MKITRTDNCPGCDAEYKVSIELEDDEAGAAASPDDIERMLDGAARRLLAAHDCPGPWSGLSPAPSQAWSGPWPGDEETR